MLCLAAAGTSLAGAIVVLPEAGVTSVIPVLVGIAFAVAGWSFFARYRRLARADAVTAGVVTDTRGGRGSWWSAYEFFAPGGPHRGTATFQVRSLVQDFGFRPDVGDTVFVVYDSRDPSRNEAWGFALSPGCVRDPGWLDRAVPRWILGVLAMVAVVVACGVVWASRR